MPWLTARENNAERRIELVGKPVTVGRAPENDIILVDRMCSRRHCQVEAAPAGYKLVDLESRNGTRVNGQTVNQSLLQNNDRIEIGEAVILFTLQPAPPDALASPPGSSPSSAVEGTSPPPAPTAAEVILGEMVSKRSGGTTRIDRRIARKAVRRVATRQKEMAVRVTAFGALTLVSLIAVLIIINAARKTAPPRGTGTPGSSAGSQTELPTGPERDRFDTLERRRREHPDDFAGIIPLCREYLREFPTSPFARTVREYQEESEGRMRSLRLQDLTRLEQQATDGIRQRDFITPMNGVVALSRRYTDDKEAVDRIIVCQKRILDAAEAYYQEQHRAAQEFIAQGDFAGARRIFMELHDTFGNGKVEGLDGYCKRVEASLKGLGTEK